MCKLYLIEESGISKTTGLQWVDYDWFIDGVKVYPHKSPTLDRMVREKPECKEFDIPENLRETILEETSEWTDNYYTEHKVIWGYYPDEE